MQQFDKLINGLQARNVLGGYDYNLDCPRRAVQAQGVSISQVIAVASNAISRD